MNYIGRFAPTPTGPLHQGSLVAAVGSYLRAKRFGGQWLVRIEDLDPPREQPGAADDILRTLEAHGLHWDQAASRQSQPAHQQRFEAACQQLEQAGLAYRCTCSRKRIKEAGKAGPYGFVYPGWCRHKKHSQGALRLISHDRPIGFTDLRTGPFSQKLASELGDFVIRRADGFYAYQLAVVVDDAHAGITEVVRGEDLLDNTPRQIHLQRSLGLPTPAYLHLPLVYNEQGQKLSKQNLAPALDNSQAAANLLKALEVLGISNGDALKTESAEEVLAWAQEKVREGEAASYLLAAPAAVTGDGKNDGENSGTNQVTKSGDKTR